MEVLTFVFKTSWVEDLGRVGTKARGLGETKFEAGVGFIFFGAIGGLEVIFALFAKEGEKLAPPSERECFFDVVYPETYKLGMSKFTSYN